MIMAAPFKTVKGIVAKCGNLATGSAHTVDADQNTDGELLATAALKSNDCVKFETARVRQSSPKLL